MKPPLSRACLLWMVGMLSLPIAWESEALFAFSSPTESQHTEIDANIQNDTEKSHHSHHCKRGPRGHKGHRGKQGHPGATGATGPTGANGSVEIPIYASIYVDNGPTIPLTENVTFNNVSLLTGNITFTPPSDSITIEQTGIYEINTGMLFPSSNTFPITFSILKNGNPIPGASITAPLVSSVLGNSQYTNSTITFLQAGDVLTLTLTQGPISVTLGSNGNVDAYMTIKQIP